MNLRRSRSSLRRKTVSAWGVHLPADVAAKIRRELHLLYGRDPGEGLTTLYGLEVLSTDAPKIKFVG